MSVMYLNVIQNIMTNYRSSYNKLTLGFIIGNLGLT